MKLQHLKTMQSVANTFKYPVRQGKWGMEPKNFYYFERDNLEFFVEIIAKWKYFKTIFIKFISMDFYNKKELIKEKKDIIEFIKEKYIEQNTPENESNLCIYSEWIINDVLF